MVQLLTDILDVIALLLVAAGAVAGLWPWLDGFALAVGGVVIGAGSWWSARRRL